jgi:hypothetical protein
VNYFGGDRTDLFDERLYTNPDTSSKHLKGCNRESLEAYLSELKLANPLSTGAGLPTASCEGSPPAIIVARGL